MHGCYQSSFELDCRLDSCSRSVTVPEPGGGVGTFAQACYQDWEAFTGPLSPAAGSSVVGRRYSDGMSFQLSSRRF